MNPFEYLSVLVSIIIGLAMSHLLSGTARLIQARRRVRWYAPTLIWLVLLFLAQVQIWWAAFDARQEIDWNFFGFLSFLLIPACAYLLCYLLVPDFEPGDDVDLERSFHDNQRWFFGLFATIVAISMSRDLVEDGRESLDEDMAFRVVFFAGSIVAAFVRSPRFHLGNAILSLTLFCGYIAQLFARLP